MTVHSLCGILCSNEDRRTAYNMNKPETVLRKRPKNANSVTLTSLIYVTSVGDLGVV